MKIHIAASSHIGNIKKSNQDRILARVGELNGNEFGLFVVADGMGGLSQGEHAAEIAIQEAERWWNTDLRLLFETNRLSSSNIESTLHALLMEVHEIIQNESQAYGESMGTTVSILWLMGQTYFTIHVGDSRIYMINQEIKQLTKDHSWVQVEVDAGRLTLEEAAIHPQRNALVQCAGMPGKPNFNVNRGAFCEDTTFILCTDGFYHYLSQAELIDSKRIHPQQLETWLTQMQNHILHQKAHDNTTAIVVATKHDSSDHGILSRVSDYFKSTS